MKTEKVVFSGYFLSFSVAFYSILYSAVLLCLASPVSFLSATSTRSVDVVASVVVIMVAALVATLVAFVFVVVASVYR